MQLSELPVTAQSQQNPFFGSLQRRPNYTPNIVEVDAHPYYGLPDVILLQNYGMIPQSNYNLTAENFELRRRWENEYRNSLMEHELKKRFNSMLNLREQQVFNESAEREFNELNVDQWFSNDFDLDRERSRQSCSSRKPSNLISNVSYYPNVDGNFMEMRNRPEQKQNTPDFFLAARDQYDQEAENFFGKKPELYPDNKALSVRPDQFFSQAPTERDDNLLELSEQFSDNFKDNSEILDSSDNMYDVNGERGDTENTVEDKNAQTGGAWVNFVNV